MKLKIKDDNKEITQVMSLHVESNAIECRIADVGREQYDELENAQSNELIDLAMPRFSGFDVFNTLKKEGLVSSNKIVVFAASSMSDENIDQMLDDGANPVLKKPVSLHDLHSVVTKFAKPNQ